MAIVAKIVRQGSTAGDLDKIVVFDFYRQGAGILVLPIQFCQNLSKQVVQVRKYILKLNNILLKRGFHA